MQDGAVIKIHQIASVNDGNLNFLGLCRKMSEKSGLN